MKNNATLVYNACLLVGDFLALLLAFVFAYVIRAHLYTTPVAHPIAGKTYFEIFASLLPFWIIIFALLGLYNQQIYERRFSELGRLLVGSFLGFLFVLFWNFVTVHPIFPSKLVPVYGLVLSFVFLVIFRNIARYVRTKLFAYNVGLNNILIVGNTGAAEELINSLADSQTSGYKILGVVGGERAVKDHPKVHSFKRFLDAIEHITLPIHTVMQTELYADETRNREVLEYAQTHHIAYRFVPGNTELFVGNIDVELFRNSVPVIAVHQTALIGWGRIVKRLFDLLVGLILLLIASPFILVIALAELFSGGDVFFRQTRLTRFNNKFRVFKFRTLKKAYNNMSPEDGFTKMGRPELIKEYRDNGDQIPNDPRFSKLGNFLRKSSLDELPQLFNILRGDISLVGPRPLVPEELSKYDKRHAILSVKSGLTGLAQVSGRRNISFEERRKLDLYYVQNWSFWLDLVIIAKTVRVIFEGS